MKKIEIYFPYLLFLFLVFVLFYKGFFGFVIQGIDTALWVSKLYKENALFTPFNWNPIFWLGMSNGTYLLGIYWVVCQLFPLGETIIVTYIFRACIFLFFS